MKNQIQLEHLEGILKQIEFGRNYFTGSCMSCYTGSKEQEEQIEYARELDRLSDKLETIVEVVFGVKNIGNHIQFKWVKS